MKKIYFKTSNLILLLIGLPFMYAFMLVLLFFSIINEIVLIFIVSMILLLLISLGVYFSFIYGFKITNNKIRIISQMKVKTFKQENIESVKILFVKKKKKYRVQADVYEVGKEKPIVFDWNFIYAPKGGSTEFNITDKNIDKYINAFTELEKFNVEVIK